MKKLETIHSFALKNDSSKINGGAEPVGAIGIDPSTYVFITTYDVVADGSSYSDVQCVGD
ncbi:MAG: hypothetical protein WBB45_02225 [Cyclobacteriaceae bacterium]